MKLSIAKKLASLLVCILSSQGLLLAEGKEEEAPGMILEPLSMTISKFDRNTFGNGVNPFSPVAMNTVTGTSLLVKVTPASPWKGRLVLSKGKLISFRDDKGTDLLSLPKNQKRSPFKGGSKNMQVLESRRGDLFGIQLSGAKAPSAGATHLIAEGSLFFTAGVRAEVEHGALALKSGSIVKVGPLRLIFSQNEVPGFSEGIWLVQILHGSEVVDASLQLFGADAKKPICDPETVSGSRFSNNGVVSYGFNSPEGKVSRIKIRYSSEENLVELPFKLKTRLGDFAGGGRLVDPHASYKLKPGFRVGPKAKLPAERAKGDFKENDRIEKSTPSKAKSEAKD